MAAFILNLFPYLTDDKDLTPAHIIYSINFIRKEQSA
jgi:hypothetical protein